ncbi:MAG: sulfatase [bacterium]
MGGTAALISHKYALAATPSTEKKPNFVFILIDDMGWTDLGCYGSTFYETPHIDRLAAQGMRFTDAYAACTVCSPTRASILTGKYPARLHLTDWISGHRFPWAKLWVPDFNQQLPLQETTLAEALRPLGYVSASIGKWHLGQEDYYPEKQGFDINIAGTHRGSPPRYFSPYEIPTLKDGEEGEYLTDRLADDATRFIEKNAAKPFFLYWSHFAVHTPIQAKKDLIEKYETKVNPKNRHRNPTYAAMIQSVDEAVGRLTAKLDKLGLTDNTVVIFMSDNGGLRFMRRKTGPVLATDNAPLREGKGSAYEGGVREPMIVRWSGTVEPGSVCTVPVISTDFYPHHAGNGRIGTHTG